MVRVRQVIAAGQAPELRYANIGAEALATELGRAEIKPPSRATINRLLQRHQLVRPKQRKNKKRKLPDDYPWPWVRTANDLHLFDFVSRSIRGEGRFYGFHLLDHARRWPYVRAETPKSAEKVVAPAYLDKNGQALPDDAPAEQIAESVYDVPIRQGILFQPHPAFAAFTAVAAIEIPSPTPYASIGRGANKRGAAVPTIAAAAATISPPSTTAEKYSALL